jgi:Zn-dependent peptidase ImmA (M78 family)
LTREREAEIIEAVNKAREFFEIKDFPGDFFSYLTEIDYTSKYKLILFREDIDKLSGFIGYAINDYAVICINYQRPIGHQNFTLAHEVGHWFLHKGTSFSDDSRVIGYSSNKIEQDANAFASEILYPDELLSNDYIIARDKSLFGKESREQLGNYVNELCHKYVLSYEMVLRRLLYKNGQGYQYQTIRKEIEKALGGKIAEKFDRDFYVPNEGLPHYQKFVKPYNELQRKIDYLVEKGKLGKATGEAIKLRNGVKID